ncbi:hypothetical protein ATCC53582_00214 [Novacetimonas hansenii]|nr:hypothetical protein ATCC53582_00214 [Novacetimonas hansenii]
MPCHWMDLCGASIQDGKTGVGMFAPWGLGCNGKRNGLLPVLHPVFRVCRSQMGNDPCICCGIVL